MNYLFFQIDKGMKEEPTKRISYSYPSGSWGTTTTFDGGNFFSFKIPWDGKIIDRFQKKFH